MTITILTACGSGESSRQDAAINKQPSLTVDNAWGGFPWQVANGVNQNLYTPLQIKYPAQGYLAGSPMSYADSVAQGVATGAAMIQQAGQFVLIGSNQGAQVVSELLVSLQSGDLAAYLPNLLAGITFSNPWRENGHSWPGDPTGCTGQGIDTGSLLTDTPDLWWDMTNTYDLLSNIPTGGAGDIINDIWTAAGQINLVSVPQIAAGILAAAQQADGDFIGDLIAGFLADPLEEGADLVAAIAFLLNAVTRISSQGVSCYGTAQVGSTGLTFVQTAISYLNSFV